MGNNSDELKDGLSFLPCHSVGIQARNSPTQDEAKRLGEKIVLEFILHSTKKEGRKERERTKRKETMRQGEIERGERGEM